MAVQNANRFGLAQNTEGSCLALIQRWLVDHRWSVVEPIPTKDHENFLTPAEAEAFQGKDYGTAWDWLMAQPTFYVPPQWKRESRGASTWGEFLTDVRGCIGAGYPVATILFVVLDAGTDPAPTAMFLVQDKLLPMKVNPTTGKFGAHSVVITDIDDASITVRVPRFGEAGNPVVYPLQEFEAAWSAIVNGGHEYIWLAPK